MLYNLCTSNKVVTNLGINQSRHQKGEKNMTLQVKSNLQSIYSEIATPSNPMLKEMDEKLVLVSVSPKDQPFGTKSPTVP